LDSFIFAIDSSSFNRSASQSKISHEKLFFNMLEASKRAQVGGSIAEKLLAKL
jgi:hypothetical protein